jgi:hypothetical protein
VAKLRHLSQAQGKSNRGKQLGPRERIDVLKLSKAQQRRLIPFGLEIQRLVAEEDILGSELDDDVIRRTARAFEKRPQEIRDALMQYRRYHETYKNQHPANAFAPFLPKQKPTDRKNTNKAAASPQQRVRRGIPIERMPELEQTYLRELADAITALIATEGEQASATSAAVHKLAYAFNLSLTRTTTALKRHAAYRATYPDEHPANAHTPELPPQGMPIALVAEPEQSRIIAFGNTIAALIEKQGDGQTPLPPGELAEAAKECNCTEDWISKSIARQRLYRIAYPDEPFHNAHTPRPVGRPKGRKVAPQVKDTIEKATTNKVWLSRNGRGGYDKVTRTLPRGKDVHSLVENVHGKVHSKRTTYRIIKDYKLANPARWVVVERGVEELQKHLPGLKGRVKGPGQRSQFDIRPFPTVVNYKGQICTVHGMWLIDDFTDYVPAWKLLPTKNVNTDGEVHTVDFTCKMARATIARACRQVQGRWRVYYADNGTQFNKALKKYMHFMVAAGEEPTALVPRRRRRPRGGGNVEVSLKLIDEFLRWRPAYINEKRYRTEKVPKSEIPLYEDFVADFAAFVHHWNHDPDPETNGPSRYALFEEGPKMLLSLPEPLALAMFACGSWRDQRDPRTEGDCWFRLDGTHYVALRTDPQMYKAFADCSAAGREIDIQVFEFDEQPRADDRIVLFSLDGEQTWDLAVPEGTRDLSRRKHTQNMIQVEQELERGEHADKEAFYRQVILDAVNGPLVFDALRRKKGFYRHHSAEQIQDGTNGGSEEEQPAASSPAEQLALPFNEAELGIVPQAREQKQDATPASSAPPQVAPTPPSLPPSQAASTPRPPIPNFIAKRQQRRQEQHDGEG